MTHEALDVLLVFFIAIAYIAGKFRGFRDGCRVSDDIIDSRNREIEEMLRTGKASIEVSYRAIED